MLTAAHLAYAHHHVYGMALFNTQYYGYIRLDGRSSDALSQPAAAMGALGNPQAVAQSSQHYFLTSTHYRLQQICNPARPEESVCDQLPFAMSKLQKGYNFSLDMAPPSQGWASQGAMLRVTFLASPSPGRPAGTSDDYRAIHDGLSVSINGYRLSQSGQDLTWPSNPADGAVNNAYYKALWWTAPTFNLLLPVDPSMLRDGINSVSIHFSSQPGQNIPSFRIVNFEFVLPAKGS